MPKVHTESTDLGKPVHQVAPFFHGEANNMVQPKDEAALQKSKSPNPYLFIVGSPRSGTTMLRRMIGAHPKIAITRETHWVPKFFKRKKGISTEGFVSPELLDELQAYHRFSHLKVKRADLENHLRENAPITYSEFVSSIYDRFAQKKLKPFAGDKTPTYVRNIATLGQLWPSAKFLHLIRDGRDVCLSMLNWRMNHKAAGRFSTWQEDPVATTALWWRALVMLGQEDGKPLGEAAYCEIQYENLLRDTNAECQSICKFLQFDFEESMLHYYAGKTVGDKSLSANAAWLPPTKGLRDWRTQMPLDAIERFEAVAGDLLTQLGYERRFLAFSSLAKNVAKTIKQKFTAHAEERKWRLPQRWEELP